MPAAYYEQPELLPKAEFYWRAFCDLGSERQSGMSVGPIPRSKALEYACEMGIETFDEFERFWAIIAEVDRFTLKLINSSKKDDEGSKVAADDAVGTRQVMTSLQGKQKRKK